MGKSKLEQFIKEERKRNALTQEDLARMTGVGLRFIRDMEQGKKTLRLDKINQVLAAFGTEMVPRPKGEGSKS